MINHVNKSSWINIGKKIKEALDENGYSYEKCAKLLGYKNKASIFLLIKGKTDPHKKLYKIAEITGRDMDWFFEKSDRLINKKAQKYDHLERQLLQLVETVLDEDHYFFLLGISHPKLKRLCRAMRGYGEDEINEILKPVRILD